MSFLSILKKIGQDVNLADQYIPVYGQLIHGFTSMIPGSSKIDNAVSIGVSKSMDGLVAFQKIVLDAEVFGQAAGIPGAQKAAGIAPAVLQLFLDLPILQGEKPKDPVSAKAKAAALGGALADFINEFEG